MSRGRMHHPEKMDGLIAIRECRTLGLLTYEIENGQCEIVSLDSFLEDQGVRSSLLNASRDRASSRGCHRLWLITANDNLRALGFYQRRGLRIVAVHRNALEESRKVKPEIPIIGMNSIPLRDEIELETCLNSVEKNLGEGIS